MKLLCPRCEKPMEPEHECRRKLSRRFFFGLLAAPLASKLVDVSPPLSVERYMSSLDLLSSFRAVYEQHRCASLCGLHIASQGTLRPYLGLSRSSLGGPLSGKL